jgi:3-phenylpropionate/trans-cinnamate dioxygenase ferredoxin reductase subunit
MTEPSKGAGNSPEAIDQSQAHVVIVGAGQAGLSTAESLRSGGYTGFITMLGDEPTGPYHRPPLSKAWLAGELAEAQLMMRAPELLARKGILLRTDSQVASIDRAAKQVLLADGETLSYTGLVMATGATPRTLSVPGAEAQGVLALRTRADAERISALLQRCVADALPVVVIGGGFIGLEVAATARKKGLAVTVLEAAPRLLGRAVSPMLSEWIAKLHTQHGVSLVFEARVARIDTENGVATAVQLEDGSRLPAGLVVVGVGAEPCDQLARAAGLACERGIVVDDCARTSDPAIVAAGDCTIRRLPDGSWLRLESVQNAIEQGKSAAAALLGQDRPFTAVPWFWSDQYGVKFQMAGLSAGATDWEVRGDPATGSFSVDHFRNGKLIAVDSVNASKEHLQARTALAAVAG